MTSTINASTTAGIVTTADTSGVLALQTAGTTAVTVDASQNVGIGTASPTNYANQRTLAVNGTTYGRIDLMAGGTVYGSLYGGTGGPTLSTGSALPVMFETNGTERMRIDSSGNIIYNQSSLACYVWTAFNPTNTSGTTTNAPATGTGYDTGFVTMVNSSGTLTITFDIAGKYLVSTNLQTSHANTYTNERSIFTLGGTATTATGTQNPSFSGIDSVDANTTGTYPIYVSATAAQTTTILPTYELTGTGTTAQHTCRPSVTIQYCGG